MDVEALPIDIHCTKLLTWLVSRHHCGRKWQEKVEPIQQKINAAIQDMPENEEIKSIIAGSYIDYFRALKIVDILKNTECGTKNIFGQYSSQKMRDWQEVIKLYTNEGVYLGQAAQTLIRIVTFEVPALKKQIEKCRKTQADCSRKEREHTTAAAEWQTRYQTSCQRLGIAGEQVKRELVHLANDLPRLLDRFVAALRELGGAVQLYEAVTRHVMTSLPDEARFCPLVSYLVAKGNTTLFEFERGVAPDRIEAPNLELLVAEEARDSDAEIDWGDLEEEIDFGITVEEDEKTDVAADGNDDGAGIVARGDDALRLMDHRGSREQLVTELSELSAFLTRLGEEKSGDGGLLAEAVWEGAPEAATAADAAAVHRMGERVTQLLQRLDNSTTKHLLLIRSSPRYVDRLAEQVSELSRREERSRQSARLMELRRQDAAEEERSVEPRLTALRQESRRLKVAIEAELSTKYDGRRVNIMGEVNSL